MRQRQSPEGPLTFRDMYTLRPFRLFWLTIFNILCIFFIDMRTLIPLSLIGVMLIGSMIITFQLCWRKWKKSRSDSWYHGICTGPGFVHLLLIFNFTFSFNAQQETYSFTQGSEHIHKRSGGSTTVPSTIIHLKGKVYESYAGIRVFVDDSQIYGSKVTYTFATGIFGIRVMKDWEFH